MESHESWHAWGVAAVAVLIAVAALMISSGSCARAEKVEADIEHLERRIDNLRDS